jgi:uncharacterized protein (DUF1501 family)
MTDGRTKVGGSADGTDGRLSRRGFLGLAGGLGLAAAATSPLLQTLLDPERASAALASTGSKSAARKTSARTLVLVTLYGGNDGLNTVVPYADPAYPAARGAVALDPAGVLPLAEGFGLHPSMPGFKKLWDGGHLAVVHGVGFADPNYSHFESMDIWQAGSTDGGTSSGWVGRWLDKTRASPLRAVGIGPNVAPALAGEKVQGVAIPTGGLSLPAGHSEQALYRQMAATSSSEPDLWAQAARSGSELLSADATLGPVLSSAAHANPLHLTTGAATAAAGALAIADGGGGTSGSHVLALQLSVVANLVLAGAPPQVYSVELGGFDTHSDEAPTQKSLLGELDTAVSAFVDALATDPHGRETVVLVYTEFGRRVAGNASGGTDHGWANVAFVAGAPVRGGFYGQPPGLTGLSEGNQPYTTDFRSLYATMFERVLGVDPSPFLLGAYPVLPLL